MSDMTSRLDNPCKANMRKRWIRQRGIRQEWISQGWISQGWASFALLMAICCSIGSAAHASDEDYHRDDLVHEDNFGFTSTTETGDRGDRWVGLENDVRLARRQGRYFALGSKAYAGITPADNWAISVAGFGDYHRIAGVAALPANVHRAAFDGASIEVAYRILSRSPSNPLAVTVAVEPRWGRLDGGSGLVATSTSVEAKLLADMVIVPGALFWAANATVAPARQRDPLSGNIWARGTGASLSTALAAVVSARATLGAEVRYQMQFQNYGLRSMIGHATYIGPTMAFRVAEQWSLNMVYLTQVAGHAKGVNGVRLDLDNFERRTFRVALTGGF